MPELPEVETVRRGLERLVVGKTIASIDIRVPKMIKCNVDDFVETLGHQTLKAVQRRGKYLIFLFEEAVVISHLRMEGKYLLFKDKVPDNKHFHVFFHFTDGSTLVYQDVRKFGTFNLLVQDELTDFFRQKKIGPEPTSELFQLKAFQAALQSSSKKIKPYLLEQTVVAGLGNIYVDEALWAAQVHPLRLSSSLTSAEMKQLHKGIIALMAFAIEKGGSTIRTYQNTMGMDGHMQNYLKVYGQTDHPCPRCGTPIEKIKVGGRGTHFCPKCQKL